MQGREAQLARVLGLGALVVYGVGDILGAGIYALMGRVAGVAGHGAWISFAVAVSVAGLTALAYAELGGRFPRSAGEAHFVRAAFGKPWASLLVGWLVLCSGVVSIATVSRAFGGYLHSLVPAVPIEAAGLGMLCALALLAFHGMRTTSATNITCTLIEATGLLVVVTAALIFLAGQTSDVLPLREATTEISWEGVLRGGALAFFAFIGFEDMVNVAEEVRDPQRTLPIAIITALALAGTVYVAVAWLAVRVVDPSILSESPAPLLEVVERGAPLVPRWGFTLIALFAVSNTALLNLVMASRLLYGMSRDELLPAAIGAVHAGRRTPHIAIGVVFGVAALLALSSTLVSLAGTTSALILCVFATVNASLLVIRARDSSRGFRVPLVVPVLGILGCLGLLAFVPFESYAVAAAALAIGLVIVLLSPAGKAR